MRIYLLVTTVFLSLSAFCQIPTNGLQVSYPFTSGSTNDFSPNNNHLTPSNGPTPCPDRFNNPNCAYLFDGVNDFMTAINPGPNYKKSRSVSFWAKTTAPFNSNGYTALYYGNASVGGGRFEVGLNSGCNGLYADYGFGYITKPFNTVDNNWHMYTVVYDSTVSYGITSVLYYMDASLVSVTCMTYNTTQTVNTQLQDAITIGRMTTAFPRYFNGALDDIHVYDRPLTPAEVVTIYTTAACAGPPTAPVAVLGTQTICSGSSLAYSISPISTATSYSWNLPAGWSGSSTSTLINVNAGANAGSITVFAINSCGQSSATVLNISVELTPTVVIAAGNVTVCSGNSTTLNASGAATYTWNTTSTNASIAVSPTVTTTYTVTGSNSFGCNASATKTVIVNNFPLPTITVNGPGEVCVNQPFNLACNGAATYTWQPGNMTGFFVTVTQSANVTYTITGTDNNGCYNSFVFTQTVDVCNGISETDPNDMEVFVYPNPTSDHVYIYAANFEGAVLLNLMGQVLDLTFEANKEVSLAHLPNGIYILRVAANGKRMNKKLIKN